MTWNLWLDDTRNPLYTLNSQEWTIARTYQEAVDLVKKLGFPRYVSFDHDLGIVDGVEENGADFAHWLVEYDLDHNQMPADFTFFVHSANPQGSINISSLLNNYMRFRADESGTRCAEGIASCAYADDYVCAKQVCSGPSHKKAA